MADNRNEEVLADLVEGVIDRNPGQDEFHQAVRDVADSVADWYAGQAELREAKVFERLTEPDRIVSFRVVWEDDAGAVQINRAWRVQFSHVLGPYKGGLRFSDTVNESVLKFLGFEQMFKNSLTGLPMGAAKGGADFDPKGKSKSEIARFCRSLMDELYRHIGPDIDVPAGDIGVGAAEISLLFGHYLRLTNTWHGALTGKDDGFGGSPIRNEATGYGCVYFCEAMLEHHGTSLEGKRIAISGSGNVALYAAMKAIDRGAKVVTMSDSDGFLLCDDGLTAEQLQNLRTLKEKEGGRLSEFSENQKAFTFKEDERPWGTDCDIAMPCATQNEICADDARALVDGGVSAVCEGANMPTTPDAAKVFRDADVLHAPGKASNAGGVAVSGLELTQNLTRQSWSDDRVDERLKSIMRSIHDQCISVCPESKPINYVRGANLAAFKRVAAATSAYGLS